MSEKKIRLLQVADAFSFRHGEAFVTRPLASAPDARLAVMLAKAQPLPTPSEGYGEPLVLMGAAFVNGNWRWLQFAPQAKERLAEHINRNSLPIGEWLAITVLDEDAYQIADGNNA